MTNKDLDQARAWARDNIEGGYFHGGDRALAAAHVIQSLPDTVVDGDKLREVINKVLANTIHGTVGHQVAEDYAALIGELIPTPPLPTLADMTPEEREACQWMQAELDGDPEMRVVIASILPAGVHVLFKDGWISSKPGSSITPLPDLPRLEWPGGGVEDAPLVDGEPTMPRPEVKP